MADREASGSSFQERHGAVVDVRPDRGVDAIFGPDRAIRETDLAADGLLAPRTPAAQDLRAHRVSGFRTEARIAHGDRRDQRVPVERV